MKILSSIVAAVFALSSLTAQAGGDWGKFKVRINATNAEKWKVKWICNANDGSTHTIDADTYPASKKTTRETNINSDKCDSGDWKLEFYIKFGSWKRVKPGASICTSSSCGFTTDAFNFQQYARPKHFNSSNKLCLKGWNFGFNKIYVLKEGC